MAIVTARLPICFRLHFDVSIMLMAMLLFWSKNVIFGLVGGCLVNKLDS